MLREPTRLNLLPVVGIAVSSATDFRSFVRSDVHAYYIIYFAGYTRDTQTHAWGKHDRWFRKPWVSIRFEIRFITVGTSFSCTSPRSLPSLSFSFEKSARGRELKRRKGWPSMNEREFVARFTLVPIFPRVSSRPCKITRRYDDYSRNDVSLFLKEAVFHSCYVIIDKNHFVALSCAIRGTLANPWKRQADGLWIHFGRIQNCAALCAL